MTSKGWLLQSGANEKRSKTEPKSQAKPSPVGQNMSQNTTFVTLAMPLPGPVLKMKSIDQNMKQNVTIFTFVTYFHLLSPVLIEDGIC